MSIITVGLLMSIVVFTVISFVIGLATCLSKSKAYKINMYKEYTGYKRAAVLAIGGITCDNDELERIGKLSFIEWSIFFIKHDMLNVRSFKDYSILDVLVYPVANALFLQMLYVGGLLGYSFKRISLSIKSNIRKIKVKVNTTPKTEESLNDIYSKKP